jgi:peroxiredoxin
MTCSMPNVPWSAAALALAACGSGQTASDPQPVPVAGDTQAPAADPPAGTAAAEDAPENPAPDFTLTDLDGAQHTLSSLRGKTVVLEWFNPGCPFVRHAHGEGPLRDLAARHQASGIVWLAINSGAPGQQGHGVDVNRKAAREWKMDHPILVDESGQVGRAYRAKATPHMYVIDPRGSLVYRGALDNAPLGKVPADGHAIYVNDALAAVAEGRPIDVTETKPYGCTVKYAD